MALLPVHISPTLEDVIKKEETLIQETGNLFQ